MRRYGVLCLLLAVAACGGGSAHPKAPAAVSPPAASRSAAVPSPAASPTPRRYDFGHGYPKVVSVASLPFQVRTTYQDNGYRRAVQVGPGVWTPLTPGSSVADAVESGELDGFCASVHAWERRWAHGQQFGGSCW